MPPALVVLGLVAGEVLQMRAMSNCWLVAMWIWAAGHFRQYAWVRRSHSFHGLIPHFGAAERAGWRYLRAIEYIPPKRDLWTRRNKLLLFNGHYRVWHFRLVAVRSWATKEQAMADYYWGAARQCDSRQRNPTMNSPKIPHAT